MKIKDLKHISDEELVALKRNIEDYSWVRDNLLVLWVEDDVSYIDKEYTDTAFRRITGMNEEQQKKNFLFEVDFGDYFYNVYNNGWIKVISCEGGVVLVYVDREN